MFLTAAFLALVLAAVATIGAMFRATGGTVDAGALAFMAWAISPYIAVAIITGLLAKFAAIKYLGVIALVISLAMLAVTVYLYVFGMNGESSTEALAFVAIPLYLHVGAYVGLGAGIVLSKTAGRRSA